MTSTALKILALVAGLLTASPVGLCCAPAKATQKSVKVRSCCHKNAPTESKPSSEPCQQTARCCCQQDATPPELAPLPSVDPFHAPAILIAPAASLPTTVSWESAAPMPPIGRSLQVLNCVWRC
ncbi:MAG: hypothetical protein IT428_05245 [Planctomycetaceae bacterium]|nr:hypothetical protein [Planctomycetaceae bacterium]